MWLAFRGITLEELRATFAEIHIGQIAVAYAFAISGCLFRAIQWFFVLRAKIRVPLFRLFSSIMIGFCCNFLMPARIGELVRAGFTAKAEGLRFTTVLTTVAVTRILDGLALLLILAYVMFSQEIQSLVGASRELSTTLTVATYTLGGICAIALVVATSATLFRDNTQQLAERLVEWVAPWRFVGSIASRSLKLFEDFIEGLRVIRSKWDLLAAFSASLVVWTLGGLTTRAVMQAFEVTLPLVIALFVLVVVSLGVAIPGAPGYVGQFHAACRYSLVPFSVPAAKAASIATCLHALHFSYSVVIGGAFLIAHRSLWTQVRDAVE